jgi:transcriptional regulator with XRE-family HTH domain
MLNDQFREARITAGLSQSELARRAGVPRRQIQLIENGANITIDTLRRVAPALPNLKHVTLGTLEMSTAGANLDEVRRAALDLFDYVKRLVAAIGDVPAASSPAAAVAPVVVRPGSGSRSETETAQRLEKMVREGKHKRRRTDA